MNSGMSEISLEATSSSQLQQVMKQQVLQLCQNLFYIVNWQGIWFCGWHTVLDSTFYDEHP